MATKQEWLTNRLAYLRGLKAPTDAQRLLLLLADKPDRTPAEEKTFATLASLEKSAEFAANTLARTRTASTKIANAAKEAERKARTKRLIELGALVDMGGLGDLDRGALLGFILGGAKIVGDSHRWEQWKHAGDAFLAERESGKKSSDQTTFGLNARKEPETLASQASPKADYQEDAA